MRNIRWFLLLALVAPSLAGQARLPQASEKEARVFRIFSDRVQQYVKLQKNVEASLPSLKPTSEVARIAEHQHALARKIAQARSGAHQGDIFTHEVTRHFLKIIRSEFQGPEAQNARGSIRPDDPSKFIVRLRVNDIYPEDAELTTTPPALLNRLPQLPQELAYRIVGRDLVLKDTKAGLIVDLIPNAVP
jgi:hypothetical protein